MIGYVQVYGNESWGSAYTTTMSSGVPYPWQYVAINLPSAPPAGPEPPLQRMKRRNQERQQRGQQQSARLRRRGNRYMGRPW